MAARKGIHPSHDRPCPENGGVSRVWIPARQGFPPLVWDNPGSSRTGAWFSVPLDQPPSAMSDPLVTNVQGHNLSSLLWNFRTQPLSHPPPPSCLRRGQQAKNSNRCSF